MSRARLQKLRLHPSLRKRSDFFSSLLGSIPSLGVPISNAAVRASDRLAEIACPRRGAAQGHEQLPPP